MVGLQHKKEILYNRVCKILNNKTFPTLGVPGLKIYGEISAAVEYLENIKESYLNFLRQSWYNWTHPYEK